DRRDAQDLGDARRDLDRDHLQHDRDGAGLGDGQRVLAQALGRVVTAALHARAAEQVLRLGREAEVPDDGDARVGERADLRRDTATALELDAAHARLLEETHARGERLLRAGLVRPERQVDDGERTPGRARDG